MITTRGQNRMTIKRLADAGKIARVLPGVYLEEHELHDPRMRCAAVVAWDPDAIILGDAAAHLQFWPECSVRTIAVSTKRRLSAPGYRFTAAKYVPESIREPGGLRLTNCATTALDLAEVTEGNSIDQALRSRTTTVAGLRRALELRPGSPGNRARARYLLESRDGAWSGAERAAHRELRHAGIAGWRANRPVSIQEHNFFIDIAFDATMLAVEVDGFAVHHTREAFSQDRRRHTLLTLAGWTVLHFSADDVFHDPATMVAQVREALGQLRRAV